jgi:hypothetical protein
MLVSLSPGRSDVLSTEIAGRSWAGAGARVDRCRSRFSIWSYMVYGVYAGREVVDLCGHIWHCLGFFLCFMMLRWSDSKVWLWREVKISINKVASGGYGGRDWSGWLLSLVRHGDGCLPHLQLGITSASCQRITTAPWTKGGPSNLERR